MRLPSRLALALLAVLPCAVAAEPLRYTWIEGGLVADGDSRQGLFARGSVGFGDDGDDGLYLAGGLARREGDAFGGGDLTVEDVDVALGYRHVLDDHWDLIGELGATHTRAKPDGAASRSDSGLRAAIGTRVGFSDRLEGLARLDYRTAGRLDGQDRFDDGGASATVGLQFMATTAVSISTEAEFGDHGEVYRVGVRVRF